MCVKERQTVLETVSVIQEGVIVGTGSTQPSGGAGGERLSAAAAQGRWTPPDRGGQRSLRRETVFIHPGSYNRLGGLQTTDIYCSKFWRLDV